MLPQIVIFEEPAEKLDPETEECQEQEQDSDRKRTNRRLDSIFSRRASRFSDLVTIVSPQKPAAATADDAATDSLLRVSQPTLRRFSTPVNIDQRRRSTFELDQGLHPGDEVKSFGAFVFFHGREKRFVEGLRRKAVPKRLFAASFTFGLAVGSVVGIVTSVLLRVLL